MSGQDHRYVELDRRQFIQLGMGIVGTDNLSQSTTARADEDNDFLARNTNKSEDVSLSEIENFYAGPSTSRPSSFSTAVLYHETDTKQSFIYTNNEGWDQLNSATTSSDTIQVPYSYIIGIQNGSYFAFDCYRNEITFQSRWINGVLNSITKELGDQGGTIFIPRGGHPVTSPIKNLSDVQIISEGPIHTTNVYDATEDGLRHLIDAREARNVVLSNFQINGRGKTGVAVDLSREQSLPTRSHLHQVVVRDAEVLIDTTNNEDWQISQSSLLEYARHAIVVNSTQGHGTIQRTLLTHNATSGESTVKLREGKIDFDRCAIEGGRTGEPTKTLVDVGGNTRASFSQCWLYSEICPNVLVTTNNGGRPSVDFNSCEMFLRDRSDVSANVIGDATASRITMHGGWLRNAGTESNVVEGEIEHLGFFGTSIVGTVDDSTVGDFKDLSFVE